jgi:hypothetical protein
LRVIDLELIKAIEAHTRKWEKYDEIQKELDKFTAEKSLLVKRRIASLCSSFPLLLLQGDEQYQPPKPR